MINFDTFSKEIINPDLQRKNLFSVQISTFKGNAVSTTLDSWLSPLKSTGQSFFGDILNSSINYAVKKGTQKIDSLINSDSGRSIMAMLNSSVVTGFLGQMETGSDVFTMLEGANGRLLQTTIKAVTLPEVSIQVNSAYNDSVGRNHHIGQRSDSPLTLTFRVVQGQKFHSAMMDYMNLVSNQLTNGRMFAEDIECDISVFELDRNQLPVQEHLFKGCIPVRVSNLSYDWDSEGIQEFEVDFQFLSRYQQIVGDGIRQEYKDELGYILGSWGAAALQGRKPWDMPATAGKSLMDPNKTGSLGAWSASKFNPLGRGIFGIQ